MSFTFADTHNMVAYLNKSDASEGFNQVIDFPNGSYIKYALTANPTIYVTCIKQFWNTVVVKQSNDVTMLQALVDRKKVVITEAVIRDVLRLDDADGVDCLPNEEIFAELARMGYEKPSAKLTFYKAFFSSQWKFLIHTILQSMSAKRTSWNEFSSAMASAIICLSTGRKFNFSKCIFKRLVRNVDSSSKFYMYPRVRKGFSWVETPLFKGMLVIGEPGEQGDAEEQIQDNVDDAAQGADTPVLENDVQDQSIPSPTPPALPLQQPQDLSSTSQVQSPPPQPQSLPPTQPQGVDFSMSLLQEALDACAALTRRVEHLEHDKVAQALEITKLKKRVKKLERANKVKVLKLRILKKGRMIADLDRDTGVALMDDEGTKKKAEDAQVAGDEQVKGRQAEIYQINMDHASKMLSMQEDKPEVQEAVEVVITAKLIIEVVAAVSESVSAASVTIVVVLAATITTAPIMSNKRPRRNSYVQRYQVMKKRPQTEAQARRNMIMYLKNVAGFRLDYFKWMSYDNILPIFEAKFNSNIEFLLKSKEQIEEEENRALERINETPAQKAAKRRKLNDEVEELKQHLEIVLDEDDDVYTEATLLARKVPVVDYQIIQLNNKPYYKIIRADGTHQLYVSFITLLKNFDREDLEAMFGRPDGQDQVWKSQRNVHGQAKKIPTLKVYIESNAKCIRLRVEEQSEMSLELIRFIRQQLQEGQHE
nr:hypothetical protein [Tanacetum cinerariifolium]